MRRRPKIEAIVMGTPIILAVIGGIAALVLPRLHTARGSEARAHLGSFVTAQKTFFSEYGRFAESIQDSGYWPEESLRGKFYINPKDIPLVDQKRLTEKLLPFIGPQNFQVLYVMEDQIWVATPNRIWKACKLKCQ